MISIWYELDGTMTLKSDNPKIDAVKLAVSGIKIPKESSPEDLQKLLSKINRLPEAYFGN